MATLETQYKNYITNNKNSNLTFEEWQVKFGEDLTKAMENMNIETAEYFNFKYRDFLEEGHYGLDIDIPEVVAYLDRIFTLWIKQNFKFKYTQIKLKFNTSRFYASIDADNKEQENEFENDVTLVETTINYIVAKHDIAKLKNKIGDLCKSFHTSDSGLSFITLQEYKQHFNL